MSRPTGANERKTKHYEYETGIDYAAGGPSLHRGRRPGTTTAARTRGDDARNGNGTARSGRRAPGGGIRPAALRETRAPARKAVRRTDGSPPYRPPRRAAGEVLSLRECLEKGLERNYDIRIVRNEERITDNDATAANAGMLPTIDLSAGYGSNVNRIRTTPREGDVTTAKGVYDGTFDAGVALNWTLFDGFRIRADYRKLQELKEKGALQTRLTIEDFIASFTAEYYNFVQQTLRLENFRYAMALSRERLRIAEAWYHVGSSAQLDVLQARVDFNADSSQYMSQQEAVVASRIRINELLANEELDRGSSCATRSSPSTTPCNGTSSWPRPARRTPSC